MATSGTIQLGIDPVDISHSVRFRNSHIEDIFTFNRSLSISLGKQTVTFRKNDILLVTKSYKFKPSDFEKILRDYFPQITVFTNRQSTYGLAACSISPMS